jgi:hypothetical protein
LSFFSTDKKFNVIFAVRNKLWFASFKKNKQQVVIENLVFYNVPSVFWSKRTLIFIFTIANIPFWMLLIILITIFLNFHILFFSHYFSFLCLKLIFSLYFYLELCYFLH